MVSIGTIVECEDDIYGGKWGLVDITGKLIIPLKYDDIVIAICDMDLDLNEDESIAVRQNGKWGGYYHGWNCGCTF